MAEILHGLAEHRSHAPLSHAQTIAVCRYLHDITTENAGKVEDLRTEATILRSTLDTTRGHVRTAQATIADLRQDLSERSAELNATREIVQMNVERCKRLVNEVSENSTNIDQLRAGQKITNTNVHGLREDTLKNGIDIGALRKDLDTAVHQTISALADRLRISAQKVQQLTVEHTNQRESLWECKDRIGVLEVDTVEATAERARLLETDVAYGTLLADAARRDEELKVNLEMTNGVIMKMHDGFEEAQTFATGLRTDIRAVVARCAKLEDDHRSKALAGDQTRLDHQALSAAHGSTREKLDKVVATMQGLRSGFESTGNALKQVSIKVEQLTIQAACTEENLKVTNSYVLPNLNTGVEVDPKFAANTGTCTGGLARSQNSMSSRGAVGGGSAAGPQAGNRGKTMKSPGRNKAKEKEATWIIRNIGAVPDRMAWM